MNKKLSRAIMRKSQLKTKYNKTKSIFDWITWKNQRNLCVKLRRQAIKDHFKLKCKNGTMNSKQFWKMIKPFISNKGNTDHNDIMLIEEGKQIRDRKGVAEKLNNFFTDIIHITTGKTVIPLEEGNHEQAILNIIAKYDNHISINNIGKTNIKTTFSFRMATTSDTEELIGEINDNKPMGTDLIPPKILTTLKEYISEPIEHIINFNGFRGVLSRSKLKFLQSPLHLKRMTELFKTNYRPISVLSALSKVLEKFLFKQMSDYFDNIFSEYLSGFRKGYGCHHVLMRMIENWKNALDSKKVIAALSMDLSKLLTVFSMILL